MSIEHLAEVLAEADQAHADDVDTLADMDEGQLAYLDALGEEPDPVTDGIECVADERLGDLS